MCVSPLAEVTWSNANSEAAQLAVHFLRSTDDNVLCSTCINYATSSPTLLLPQSKGNFSGPESLGDQFPNSVDSVLWWATE